MDQTEKWCWISWQIFLTQLEEPIYLVGIGWLVNPRPCSEKAVNGVCERPEQANVMAYCLSYKKNFENEKKGVKEGRVTDFLSIKWLQFLCSIETLRTTSEGQQKYNVFHSVTLTVPLVFPIDIYVYDMGMDHLSDPIFLAASTL